MPRRAQMFTIFHALEKRGLFALNPANVDAYDENTGESLYRGPIEYPKMLFHPHGEERIVVPAEIIETPLGVKRVGEQRELIWRIAENEEQELALRSAGWHDKPSAAKATRLKIQGEGPSKDARLEALEAEKNSLAAQIAELQSQLLASQQPTAEEVNRGKRIVSAKAPPPAPPTTIQSDLDALRHRALPEGL